MKRTAKIAFPDIIFVDSLTHIVPKYYKYTSERSSKNLASKLHSLYTQKTLTDFKETFKHFSETYNNAIHKKSANLEFYDKIRLSFNSNNNYVLEIEEIYDKLGSINNYFGFTSFKKREWTLILNDLIQIYPNIDFI